jgi:peptidoglycan/xylan/chitin deacetylase (PgdA/CDA1 family)
MREIMPGQTKKKNIPILMYHSVADSSNPKFQPFAVSPRIFSEQMSYLHKNHYTPMTATQLLNARLQNGLSLPDRPVVLTFDDGFADFFTDAFPALKQYDFTATLYVVTAFVNETSRWLDSEGEGLRPMVTWEQLAEMNAYGIECGAHTHSHPHLDVLSPVQAKEEIETSKKILEDHLGKATQSFAYPFGHFTRRVQQLVQDAGFSSACAVRHTMSTENDNPFSLARLMVSRSTSMEAFAALLVGLEVSPMSAMHTFYIRARTPVWQLFRYNHAVIRRHLSGS